MFITLLIANILASLLTTAAVLGFLNRSIRGMLVRIVGEPAAPYWRRFTLVALGISGFTRGVELDRLALYMPRGGGKPPIFASDAQAWVYELVTVVTRTLEGLAWATTPIFVAALVAFVVVRGFESRRDEPRQ